MATLLRALLLLLIFSDSFVSIHSLGVGINYGQIANNLPSPSRVAYLLGSLNISRVKLYDADPNVLSAFANSDVEFVIGLGNEYLQKMTDPIQAQTWVQQHVQPYISQTKIKCITVGNEVLTGNDARLKSYLLPAMQSVNGALANLGLSKEIYVTTAHSFEVLSNSFPPSAGAFRQDLVEYIQSILNFHSQTDSPFLINAAMGHTDIQVKVSETGWPSKGDPSEIGATLDNARLYNANLLNRIGQNQGTPAKPSVPIDIFVFALFNENLKPGPVSERNYGLYYPDGTPVYNIGLQGYLPRMDYSASGKNVILFFNFLLPIALLICSL
ncbi:hypothetical protein Pfo_017953 [Paulownia fortunei]|nr:hypothetical protein Pfo_017953 [Paulownia fortunei]